jgi:F0F1-type ATP synthase assembly protein I
MAAVVTMTRATVLFCPAREEVTMRGWREGLSGLALLFQLSALVLAAALGPLLIGLALDRALGTAPLITLACALLGIAVGTIGTYRIVTRANQRISGGKK